MESGHRVRLKKKSGELTSTGAALERICNCARLPVVFVCRSCAQRINS